MNNKRRICFVTGTRADFGILTPVIKQAISANIETMIVATGMHLIAKFGYTYKEIEKAGFVINKKININYDGDSGREMAQSIGVAIIKMSRVFWELKPDIIFILGDRSEVLAAAIAANYIGIPVAHLHGGELSGHIDGIVRHAITKLSHLHFTATAKSKKRILKLGEESWRVHVSGAPALDRVLHETLPSKEKIFAKYKLHPKKKLFILIQHPVNTEIDQAEQQIQTSLDTLCGFNLQSLILYPNSDAGGKRMIKVIDSYKNTSSFTILPTIPQKDYLACLKYATALIGNSSSGIIEAPLFHLPVINIGSRQSNREKATNVIDVNTDQKEIARAIKIILNENNIFYQKCAQCSNPYGDGHASERIIKVLSKIDLNLHLLQKQLTF